MGLNPAGALGPIPVPGPLTGPGDAPNGPTASGAEPGRAGWIRSGTIPPVGGLRHLQELPLLGLPYVVGEALDGDLGHGRPEFAVLPLQGFQALALLAEETVLLLYRFPEPAQLLQ